MNDQDWISISHWGMFEVECVLTAYVFKAPVKNKWEQLGSDARATRVIPIAYG